jgi:phage terminase small subunit
MLTRKQQRFVSEYILDLNAAQSAIRAGYSEQTARQLGAQLLTNINVKEEIDKQLQMINSEKIASAVEVLERITEVLRDPTAKDNDVLKAAELMAKRYSLLIDKTEATGSIEISLSDDLKYLSE